MIREDQYNTSIHKTKQQQCLLNGLVDCFGRSDHFNSMHVLYIPILQEYRNIIRSLSLMSARTMDISTASHVGSTMSFSTVRPYVSTEEEGCKGGMDITAPLYTTGTDFKCRNYSTLNIVHFKLMQQV